MAVAFDPETLARFRRLPPGKVYQEAREAVYKAGATNSGDFLDVYEELVNQGILSWDQIEEYDSL